MMSLQPGDSPENRELHETSRWAPISRVVITPVTHLFSVICRDYNYLLITSS